MSGRVSGKRELDRSAGAIVSEAERLSEVTSVVLGENRMEKGGSRRIAFMEITGGLKVTLREPGIKQIVFVYTSDVKRTQSRLRTIFDQLK